MLNSFILGPDVGWKNGLNTGCWCFSLNYEACAIFEENASLISPLLGKGTEPTNGTSLYSQGKVLLNLNSRNDVHCWRITYREFHYLGYLSNQTWPRKIDSNSWEQWKKEKCRLTQDMSLVADCIPLGKIVEVVESMLLVKKHLPLGIYAWWVQCPFVTLVIWAMRFLQISRKLHNLKKSINSLYLTHFSPNMGPKNEAIQHQLALFFVRNINQ